jgi:hypothetical protein
MNFKFPCPHCGQRIGAAPEDVGTLGGCPRCQRQFVVPEPPDAAPAAMAEIPAEPNVPHITHRGASIVAILLSIIPALNLFALVLAIYAIVRSERPGRRGERGFAIAAVVIASVLLVPVNVVGAAAGYTALYMNLKPATAKSTTASKVTITTSKATISPSTPAKTVKH